MRTTNRTAAHPAGSNHAGSNRPLPDRASIDLDALGELFPHRVAKVVELIGLGLGGQLVKRRCGQGGPWQRLLPGVVLLGTGPPSRAQLVQAALRHAGQNALVTGQDALQLHGIRTAQPNGRVHVLLPRGHRGWAARSGPSVLVERPASPPRPVLRSGFLTVPLARAVVDAARRMDSAPLIRGLLTEVMRDGGVGFDELRAELTVAGNAGTRLLRQVLRELGNETRATAETWAREVVRRAGLPPPRWNARLEAGDGTPLGTVVAWWERARLAWEVDPFDFESSPADYTGILRRGCHLTTAGMVVLHTVATRIRHAPMAVTRELVTAYRNAACRSGP